MPFIKRDSVELYYEEAPGDGEPIVLVHGLGCNLTFLAPQYDAFAGLHRVVALDLRGHGQSDKPKQDYTIPGFAADLAGVLRELELARPVVVGHSMGGAIALELAARHPEEVAGIVVLDTAVLPRPGVWAGVQPVISALKSPGYENLAREFFSKTFFLPNDHSERKEAIVTAMLSTPQHVLSSAFENIFAWDAVSAVSGCHVPTLYVAASQPRGDVIEFCKFRPDLIHGQVVIAGHFLQLEVPDQVNAMIRRFLETLRPDGFSTAI